MKLLILLVIAIPSFAQKIDFDGIAYSAALKTDSLITGKSIVIPWGYEPPILWLDNKQISAVPWNTNSPTISDLKKEIEQLRMEILELKKIIREKYD